MHRPVAALLASLALAASLAPTTLGAIPANDDSSNAIDIGSIPGSITIDTTDATTSPTDPGYCYGPELGPDPGTVWFSYTASASGPLAVNTFGSDYNTTLYVLADDGAGGEDLIGCNDDTRTLQSGLRFDASAGTTYRFMVGTSPFEGIAGGSLRFNLVVGPPAQEVTLTVDPDGILKNGIVTFHGTVSCTAPTTFQSVVTVELDQGTGRKAADYIGFADITDCPVADRPFEIAVTQQVGKVKTGPVTLQAIFSACNDYECGSVTYDAFPGTVSK